MRAVADWFADRWKRIGRWKLILLSIVALTSFGVSLLHAVVIANAFEAGRVMFRSGRLLLTSNGPIVRELAAPIFVYSIVFTTIFVWRAVLQGERLPGWLANLGTFAAVLVFDSVWLKPVSVIETFQADQREKLAASAQTMSEIIVEADLPE